MEAVLRLTAHEPEAPSRLQRAVVASDSYALTDVAEPAGTSIVKSNSHDNSMETCCTGFRPVYAATALRTWDAVS